MLGYQIGIQYSGVKGGVSDSADGGAFDPLTLGPLAWWRVIPGKVWQDTAGTVAATADGDPVGRVDDLSGSGLHLLQSTAAARPVLRTSAGKYWLEFDGVDDRLRVTWAAIPQLLLRVGAVEQITWTNLDTLWDGGANNESRLRQGGTSPNLNLENPTGMLLTGEVLNAWMVITERLYGAGALSSVAVDNNTYASSGSWAGLTQSGFTVGSVGAGTSNYGNIKWGGHVLINSAVGDTDIALLRTYLGADVGKTL